MPTGPDALDHVKTASPFRECRSTKIDIFNTAQGVVSSRLELAISLNP